MEGHELLEIEHEANKALLESDPELANRLGITANSILIRFSDGSSALIEGEVYDQLVKMTVGLRMVDPRKAIVKALGFLHFLAVKNPQKDGWRYYIERKRRFGIFQPRTRTEFFI